MKTIFYFLIFVVWLSCKEKNIPAPILKPLVGKWRLVANEYLENGQKIWRNAGKQSYIISFRFDGVILQEDGLPVCCGPISLSINGENYRISPQENLPVNPTCFLVDCVGCDVWDIALTDDSFILDVCKIGARSKFERVP